MDTVGGEIVAGKENECECCGTCKWHEHEKVSDGWVCVNNDSEYVADWTDYDFCCEQYESR